MDIELDVVSIILLVLIAFFLIYPILFPNDPDTFPFILNNQSQPSKVRHPKESAIYRHRDQPHGYPLITGLALRKGYEAPRDGDLRDVWEIAIQKSLILGVVRGGKCVYERLPGRQEELTKLGSGLRELAGENGKVAVYLPNTIENLLVTFACAFHGLTSVILPFSTAATNPPTIPEDVLDLLKTSQPQVLVLSAGLALQDIEQIKSLKTLVVIDVAEDPHMDWHEEGDSIPVKTWDEVLELTVHHDPSEKLASVAIQSFSKTTKGFKSVEFTHENVIAAIASQMKLLPKDHVLSEKDSVLPLPSFSDTTSLTLTLAAMASGSTVILHPLTEPHAQVNISRQLHPTVVIANQEVINLVMQTIMGWRRESTISSVKLTLYHSRLANGRLPVGLKEVRKTLSNKLRLLYISVHHDAKPVWSHTLDLLRAGLGSHVIYALGSPWAFGPIAQTHLHDYRVDNHEQSGFGHFGAPTAGVEIKLSGIEDEKSVHGQIGALNIRGPIVIGEDWIDTELKAKWRKDGTLEIAY